MGDKVEVGRFRNVQATVLDIETDEHGQPGNTNPKRQKETVWLKNNETSVWIKNTKTDTFRKEKKE